MSRCTRSRVTAGRMRTAPVWGLKVRVSLCSTMILVQPFVFGYSTFTVTFTVISYACTVYSGVLGPADDTAPIHPVSDVRELTPTSSCRGMHNLVRGIARTGISAIRPARLAPSSLCITATTALASVPRRRNHHVRVPLPYKIGDGMGDFLSPSALKVIAESYQQGLGPSE